MTLLAVALTAVSLFGCASNQVQDRQHQLVYGRDWRLPSPTSTPEPEVSPIGAAVPKLDTGLKLMDVEIPTPTPPPPPPKPVPTTTPISRPIIPSPPVSSSSLSREALQAVLVSTGWPEELLTSAMAVAWCESNWQPSAHNASGAAGLFQEMPPWAPHFGYSYDQLFDPYVNATIALQLYRQYGWGPWVCAA